MITSSESSDGRLNQEAGPRSAEHSLGEHGDDMEPGDLDSDPDDSLNREGLARECSCEGQCENERPGGPARRWTRSGVKPSMRGCTPPRDGVAPSPPFYRLGHHCLIAMHVSTHHLAGRAPPSPLHTNRVGVYTCIYLSLSVAAYIHEGKTW